MLGESARERRAIREKMFPSQGYLKWFACWPPGGRMISPLDPNFVEGHNSLGLVLLQAGKLRTTREEFADALRLKPRYAEAHCNLALVLHQE